MKSMLWSVIVSTFVAIASVAMAEPLSVAPAELKARAERYFGKVISIEGHIAKTTREDALYGINAGEAGIITFNIWWGSDKGSDWERAMTTCGAGFRDDNQCRVIVTGVVEQNKSFPDLFSIKNATLKFLN